MSGEAIFSFIFTHKLLLLVKGWDWDWEREKSLVYQMCIPLAAFWCAAQLCAFTVCFHALLVGKSEKFLVCVVFMEVFMQGHLPLSQFSLLTPLPLLSSSLCVARSLWVCLTVRHKWNGLHLLSHWMRCGFDIKLLRSAFTTIRAKFT